MCSARCNASGCKTRRLSRWQRHGRTTAEEEEEQKKEEDGKKHEQALEGSPSGRGRPSSASSFSFAGAHRSFLFLATPDDGKHEEEKRRGGGVEVRSFPSIRDGSAEVQEWTTRV